MKESPAAGKDGKPDGWGGGSEGGGSPSTVPHIRDDQEGASVTTPAQAPRSSCPP